MNKDNNKFINHSDPTLPLDLSSVTLKEQYAKLTEQEKLLVFYKLNGYKFAVPDIDQFIEDPWYLGSDAFFGTNGSLIFPYWRKALREIFDGPICRRPYVILSGAIGIGKSTLSKISMAYTLCKLTCMENPSKVLRLAKKPLTFVIAHRSEDIGNVEFRLWLLKDVLDNSPFFKTNYPKRNFKLNVISSGPMSNMGLGTDCLFYILSEVNFWPGKDGELAQKKISTALGRFTSRFDDRVISLLGGFYIDSSASGEASPSEWFLDNTDPNKTYSTAPTQWEVKRHSFPSLQRGETFPVYIGDGKYPAQILPMDYKLSEDQDPDRVINMPMELKQEANIDLRACLMDKAGKCLTSSDSFFGGSVEHLVNCSKLVNRIPEVVTVDFYDKTDRLWDKVKPMLSLVPYHTPIWIGLDLATKNDLTGIAACTFTGWDIQGEVRMPKIKCLFIIGVSRKEGQQTSLWHIEDLIMEMKKYYNVRLSADFGFSKQILQDAEREGIPTTYISTDNTPDPAIYLKTIINNELIELPEHKRLQREAYDLRYTYTNTGKLKIDHPKKATQNPKVFDVNNGVGSKDIWDGLEQAVYSLKLSIDAGEEYGYNSGYHKQMQVMEKETMNAREETQKYFQDTLESLF